MTKYEKTTLGMGIVALIADLISISSAIFNFSVIKNSNTQIQLDTNSRTITLMITGFIIAYCWFIISWVLSRLGIRNLFSKISRITVLEAKKLSEKKVTKSVLVGGFALSPLMVFWSYYLAYPIKIMKSFISPQLNITIDSPLYLTGFFTLVSFLGVGLILESVINNMLELVPVKLDI